MSSRMQEILADLGAQVFGDSMQRRHPELSPWVETRARRVFWRVLSGRRSAMDDTSVNALDHPEVPERIRASIVNAAEELSIFAYIEGLKDGQALRGDADDD